MTKSKKTIAVIVAHPDDETLWAGGTILNHPEHDWFIVCLCRASDFDRSKRFYNVLKKLHVAGIMGDIDDGPEQKSLDENILENEIIRLLPNKHYDLIITHDLLGEYTKHLRHEEVNISVLNLWKCNKISSDELWTFAYEDGNKKYLPQAIENANIIKPLSGKIWTKKYNLLTEDYGFSPDSWEAQTTPKTEAFWQIKKNDDKIYKQFDNAVEMSRFSILKKLYKDKMYTNFCKVELTNEISDLICSELIDYEVYTK